MVLPGVNDPERSRRSVGLILYVIGILFGASLFIAVFMVPPLFSNDPLSRYAAMASAAALAFPAVVVYMTVPRLLDRYDPEPAWALSMVFVWGALAACGVSGVINTMVAAAIGDSASAVVSAPLVEEFMKGLALAGMFYFWRREFDGVVDGIIYATFVALGFAAVENVVYYARAARQSGDALTGLFVLRGLVTPWAHPLFTSMTGIGFGVARESTRPLLRWGAPLLGYLGAVFLHFVWNGSSVFSAAINVPLVLILLPLWFLFVVAFLVMVVVLVQRRGGIIRRYLEDELVLGTITREEFELTTSAFGLYRAARGPHGKVRQQLIRAAARLALSKWHAGRAMKGALSTVSFDFIGPLRDQIRALRAQIPNAPQPVSGIPGMRLPGPPPPGPRW
ncbi:MAG: PrsW family intramembrane metalloprotease [Polyangiales bacterium]